MSPSNIREQRKNKQITNMAAPTEKHIRKNDEEMATQKIILDVLEAYGDNLLDEGNDVDTLKVIHDSKKTKKQKKRKKEVNSSSQHDNNFNSEQPNTKPKGKNLWAEELELNVLPSIGNSVKSKPKEHANQTTKKVAPSVFIFTDHRKTIRATSFSIKEKKMTVEKERESDSQEKSVTAKQPKSNITLAEARKDVQKFGISGFNYEDKKKLEIQRAIKLGAKEEKREFINYKKYQEMQKEKKKIEGEQKQIDRKLGLKVSRKRSLKELEEAKRTRPSVFWSDHSLSRKARIDGQIGKYKDGIQVLTKDDLGKINQSNLSKNKFKTKKQKKLKI